MGAQLLGALFFLIYVYCIYIGHTCIMYTYMMYVLDKQSSRLDVDQRVCTTVRGPLVGTQILYIYMIYMYYINTHRYAPSWSAPACVHNRLGPSCWNTDILYVYDIYILYEYTSSRPLLSVYQCGCTTLLTYTYILHIYDIYIYYMNLHRHAPSGFAPAWVPTTVRGPLVGTQI